MSAFEDAATAAAPFLGAAALRTLAERVSQGWPEEAVLSGLGDELIDTARPIVQAIGRDHEPASQAAAFLRGLAAGYSRQVGSVGVETVWSGPSSHAVPVRATAQALVDVVAAATSELVLMTYSAKPHEPLRQALAAATARGVRTTVVVETLQGAGSALAGSEPAAAFAGVSGVQLWHWPAGRRSQRGAKMHAKLAVADRSVLLVSSANLTQSGVETNIEAGILVRGGSAPVRAAEHIAELKASGVLGRLTVGGGPGE
ncbi:DISARM system phospholipase D-like protein DrmC [Prauserella flavalba]|uniref:DISARM system phospholipase D-like protein DrmC n=1 Tax=Prauserella flavalba TaxID=1477506 RepID=UPI0036EF0D3A